MRHHGLTPFTGTDLDAVLRSLGCTTVVACGVSLNVGVLGLCLTAADLGYRVVVPTDAVVGVPAGYGDDVLANTLAMVATLSTVDDLLASWVKGGPPLPSVPPTRRLSASDPVPTAGK